MEKGHSHSQIVSTIRHYLYDDLGKSDIKEVCSGTYPGMTQEEFESCFSEAFTSL